MLELAFPTRGLAVFVDGRGELGLTVGETRDTFEFDDVVKRGGGGGGWRL